METWEKGLTRDDAGSWVIVASNGDIVKFNKARYPHLAEIVGGEAVEFTRNPANRNWAAMIKLDTGQTPLFAAAEDGAELTPAARARLSDALAERLFWASFLPEHEQALATEDMRNRLRALKGRINKQTLIDEGF